MSEQPEATVVMWSCVNKPELKWIHPPLPLFYVLEQVTVRFKRTSNLTVTWSPGKAGGFINIQCGHTANKFDRFSGRLQCCHKDACAAGEQQQQQQRKWNESQTEQSVQIHFNMTQSVLLLIFNFRVRLHLFYSWAWIYHRNMCQLSACI